MANLTILCLAFAAFGLAILLASAFAYVLLRRWSAQVTRCPECREKGAGRFVETKVLSRRFGAVEKWRGKSMRVVEETVEDLFECERCGHLWTRTAQEVKREPIQKRE